MCRVQPAARGSGQRARDGPGPRGAEMPALWPAASRSGPRLARSNRGGPGREEVTADVCRPTNYTAHGKTQSLNCTANDVRVAEVTNITIQSGGECHLVNGVNTCTCTANQPVTFTADYKVVLTAQARYDIGIYFSTDGDTNGDGALTGQCKLTTLTATNSDNFVNLDTGADACGDIDAAHNPQ